MRSRVTKKHLLDLLKGNDLAPVADLASASRRTLDLLFALTFNPDPLVVWRAVEASGIAAHRIAEKDPERVREHLRRMNWLLSEESGGVGWRAPEVMAEIIAVNPGRVPDFVPIVASLLRVMAPEDLVKFRNGVLWAIARMGLEAASAVPTLPAEVGASLDDPDPQTRGLAALCLGRIGGAGFRRELESLLDDEGEVVLYEEGRLLATRVGDLAQDTLTVHHG
jgi:hypothetical protein